jgi:hypothetical protein
MIDVLIALAAAILIALALVIMAGPTLPRRLRALFALLRHLGDRFEPEAPVKVPEVVSHLHPSTQRALQAAAELALLLRANGEADVAAHLRAAVRRLTTDEPYALRALNRLQPRLQRMSLEDDDADHRRRILVQELKVMVADRAEQLELLPFR